MRERKVALELYKKFPKLENFINYKKSRNFATKTLKTPKRVGWKKYYYTFNHRTSTSQMWAIKKSFKNKNLIQNSAQLNPEKLISLQNETINKLCLPTCLHEFREISLQPTSYSGTLNNTSMIAWF
jgi:hypothetical protein